MGWGMYRPTYTCKKTGKTKRAKKFYLWWTTPLEKKTERIPLSAVKEIALAMADRIIKERELGRVALPLSRPSFLLSTSLSDWEASLRASGVKESGVKLKLARVRQLVDGCGFKTTDDLSASKVEQFLLELRKTRSVQTSNDWLQHTKQFALWLVAEGRLDKTPFARLRAGNAQADQRRGRRALTREEQKRLLSAARKSREVFRSMDGTDRYFLYLTALCTGYRAGELAKLAVTDFDLEKRPDIPLCEVHEKRCDSSSARPPGFGGVVGDLPSREGGSCLAIGLGGSVCRHVEN